jgi:hypothetical protein
MDKSKIKGQKAKGKGKAKTNQKYFCLLIFAF